VKEPKSADVTVYGVALLGLMLKSTLESTTTAACADDPIRAAVVHARRVLVARFIFVLLVKWRGVVCGFISVLLLRALST